ncbi:SCO3242 family prenyltransferase [Dactylosporangium sp. CA-092794]|uniref:SCO3242 family prenyltransferase n=1 Tax=Dactylosporangium sp. CA-092794 TaxID=3239929 RepID=UPI003D90FFF7
MKLRWRDLVELVRAPAALSVPGDVVAGAAAAGRLGPRTAGLAAGSVLLYWAGMAANDWADREVDAKERPERPIPSGRIAPAAAFGVAAGLTAAGVAAAGLAGGRRALAIAAPLAGAVWAYDLGLKNTAAGPAAMAACRALDVLLGASGGRLRRAAWPAATVFAHTYTVTALSRAEVHGATPALPAATLAGTAAVTAAAGAGRRPVPAALAAWYAARYGAPQVAAVREPAAAKVRAAVGAGIVNLPALQGALTARAGAPIAGIAVAAAAPLGRRLARLVSPT